MIWWVIASGGVLLMAAMSVSLFCFNITMFGIPHISALPERKPDGHER